LLKKKNQIDGAESEQEKKMMQLDKEERNLKSCALIDLIHKFLVKII
jgi:hypothetical protein